MDFLGMFFRWLHVSAGILWIGLLYWLSFVHTPFSGTLDGDTKKRVVPELLPRALYFFRWGAVWTWVTGVLLLMLVFYHGQQMFLSQDQSWTLGSFVMLAVTFFMFFLYDALAKSWFGKNVKVFGAISFVLVGVVAYAMHVFGGYGYRAHQIHLGTMFGTIMIMNLWMRIWPAQKKLIPAFKQGTTPDATLVALASQRSRHNVYLSLPLVWTMMSMHTTTVGEENWWAILVVIAFAWWFISWMYGKSGRVKGL
jgi:uncharacterized membrane protein